MLKLLYAMRNPALSTARGEARTALGYSAVACVGFILDAVLLKGLLGLGVGPAWARVISLSSAMQATFLVNGFVVFRCVGPENLARSWVGYMTTNGLGNLCNYCMFLTLVSLHHPTMSRPYVAVAAGGVAAWLINYICLRFVVFRRVLDGCAPVQAVGEKVIEGAQDALTTLRTKPARARAPKWRSR